ncbi:unnamed protein product [Staurois parvus]|uniref:Uncharacterized protein n=1 Tax=Staurois parvus TaxID=386267 RepID=A0ABN9BS89_9NEOB|nr:unnamed protein product [Staurois parvus]
MARSLLGPVVPQKTSNHSQSAALLAHAQWTPGCHRSQRGKTVQRWSEEQVRPCRR